jgi:hypothetical protein
MGDQAIEGLPLSFMVSLRAASDHDVRVHVWTRDGTGADEVIDCDPADGNDYAVTDMYLTFSAGETSKTFTIDTIADSTNKRNEWFTAFAQNATNRDSDRAINLIPRLIDDAMVSQFSDGHINGLEHLPTKAGQIHVFSVTYPFGPSDTSGITYIWTIPGEPQVIKDYITGSAAVPPNNRGYVVPISEADKHSSMIEQAIFTDGYVPIDVRLQGTWGGQAIDIPLHASFNVERPDASFYATLESHNSPAREYDNYKLYGGVNRINLYQFDDSHPLITFAYQYVTGGAITDGLICDASEDVGIWAAECDLAVSNLNRNWWEGFPRRKPQRESESRGTRGGGC